MEITFTYWGSGAEKTAIEASVKTFEEANPDIKVKAMHIPSDDFLTKLKRDDCGGGDAGYQLLCIMEMPVWRGWTDL